MPALASRQEVQNLARKLRGRGFLLEEDRRGGYVILSDARLFQCPQLRDVRKFLSDLDAMATCLVLERARRFERPTLTLARSSRRLRHSIFFYPTTVQGLIA